MKNFDALLSLQTWLVLLIVIATGCQQPGSGTVVPDEFFETLVFEPLGQGFSAQVPDTVEAVFLDEDSWNEFAERLNPIGTLRDPDFEQMMVIVAVVPANSGGYGIAFDSVDLIDGEIVATYTISRPGLDCVTISALTQPFQAISVPRSEDRVTFQRKSVRESCSV
ncbi:MAG: protease complex subunit PrcB family protein [Rhodothermales bacterium]|nr:protease complex subunit PrcB family protein [Rhodothermales bacterium]